MMTWIERIAELPGPRYLAIANAVRTAIEIGQLQPGDSLPPHRDLARLANVNVSTVTRAYAEMKRRELIVGETGRGTFVARGVPDAPPKIWDVPRDRRFIDLSHNFPARAPTNSLLDAITRDVVRRRDIGSLMAYQVDWGLKAHRAAGALWLKNSGVPARPDEVVLTAGAQHGIFLAISALTRPGDVIMAEKLTFYGFKAVASLLGLTPVGVSMDEHGLLPAAFDEVCRRTGAKLLYCTPTLHNPTTSIMPAERRREIADLCLTHGVTIIEDDVYGFLMQPRIDPLASFAPHATVYVTSLSKCIGPGLRIGYLRSSPTHLARIRVALRATVLMATPLTAEIATRMIREKVADAIAENQRLEICRRHSAIEGLLPAEAAITHHNAFHIWLRLRNGWTGRQFARDAERQNVGVAPGELFLAGSQADVEAVRICISAAHDIAALRQAIRRLAVLINEPAANEGPIV